jgi:hypothetical protein
VKHLGHTVVNSKVKNLGHTVKHGPSPVQLFPLNACCAVAAAVVVVALDSISQFGSSHFVCVLG